MSAFGRLLRFALWIGLLTCAAEACVLTFQKFGLHRLRIWSPEALVLMPAGYALLFLSVGLLLAALHSRARSVFSQRVCVTVLVALSFWSILLLSGRLHPAATLLLAAGAAVAATRNAARVERVHSLAGRTIVPLAVLLALFAGAASLTATVRERRARAALPAAAPAAPNVLLLILDTVRAMSMSLHGYGRHTTPNLDLLAARGVWFERAISTAPWTLPSHASFFTGRFPFELGSGWDLPMRAGFRTLAEELSSNGYATAAFVANIYYASREFKLDRGFARYEDRPLTAGQMVLSFSLGRWVSNRKVVRRALHYHDVLNRKDAERINRDFLDWLSEDRGERPFFAFLNYYDAHEPYLPPQPFDARFAYPGQREKYWYDTDRAERSDTKNVDARAVAPQVGAYDGAIAYLDAQIGALLSELQRRGILENTLVIVTSDHGEEFAEHGELGHIENIYMTNIHVPLILSWSGHIPVNQRVAEPVSLRDIPATVMDLVHGAGGYAFPGAPLARFWRATSRPDAPLVLSEMTAYSERKSLVAGDLQYIRAGNAGDELYDMEQDPRQQNNVAHSPEYRSALLRLKSDLQAVLRQRPKW